MSGSRWAATLSGLAVAAALTACGGDDTSDADLSSGSRTPLSETSDELNGYSTTEETAYEEAVAAFKRNIRVGYRIYGDGEATPAARRALGSIYTGEALDYEWEALRDMEADGGHLVGAVRVVWTKPMRILVSESEGTVDLRACVDRRDIRAIRGGEEIRPEVATRAVFKTTLDRGPDGAWRVSGGEEIGTC
jgi:hypothetical protein